MGNVNGAGRSAWNRNLIQDGSVNIKFNGFESGSTETFNVIYDDFSKNTSNTSWYSFAVTHIAAHNILAAAYIMWKGSKQTNVMSGKKLLLMNQHLYDNSQDRK